MYYSLAANWDKPLLFQPHASKRSSNRCDSARRKNHVYCDFSALHFRLTNNKSAAFYTRLITIYLRLGKFIIQIHEFIRESLLCSIRREHFRNAQHSPNSAYGHAHVGCIDFRNCACLYIIAYVGRTKFAFIALKSCQSGGSQNQSDQN